ncbi:helix-turn-helix domain-containing protein [bacterium]|nr:helix-turn-helix domain-containing protein [bacterium]
MESIGLTLQQARQKRRLKLETIGKKTKISIRYLKALEAEDWDAFPAPTYVQAFLRNYANFLNLDSDELVREYKKYLEAAAKIPVTERLIPKRIRKPFALLRNLVFSLRSKMSQTSCLFSRRRSKIRPKRLTILPVAISIMVLIIWGGWFLFFRSPSPPVIKVTEEKKTTLILSVTAIEEVWVGITVDGKEEAQELLQAGDFRTWEAEGSLKIRVRNAGGIELELNGKPLEPLGERGQIVTKTFRREER